MGKVRLDRLLVERGLAATRTQAQDLIRAGSVEVDGLPRNRVGMQVSADARISLARAPDPYVGRGGVKLAAALDCFKIDARDLVAMDVGASTGGFTDCLLQRGAARVYAVDVGYGQLDWRLRNDGRVVVIERANIRTLDGALIPQPIDLAVVDVSFISLAKVLPAVREFLRIDGEVVALVKPQFEVGRGRVGRGGIVRDEGHRAEAVDAVIRAAEAAGFRSMGTARSPITGQKGNVEIFIFLRRVDR